MNITIIGTGNMARGISTRALAGGHNVTLVGHTQDKAKDLAAALQSAAQGGASVRAASESARLDGWRGIVARWSSGAEWTAAIESLTEPARREQAEHVFLWVEGAQGWCAAGLGSQMNMDEDRVGWPEC